MARSRKTRKSQPARSAAPRTASRETSRRRRGRRLKGLLVAVGLSMITAGGLAAYKSNFDEIHDLSVIGNGTPTVVQVHDPGCPSCQQLKRNVAAVKGRFGERLQFRIAGLNTNEGRQLAGEHDVGKVTLLLFSGAGERVGLLTGVYEPASLARRFERLAQGE